MLPSRLITFFIIICATLTAFSQQVVRIAVTRSSEAIRLQSSRMEIHNIDSVKIDGGSEFRIGLGKSGIAIDGRDSGEQVLRVLSADRIKLGNRDFRGELELRMVAGSNGDEILVVHPLPLESYVAGIVAAEVPQSFHKEALKAQAIVARTYAMWQKYRRLDAPYHLDSSVLDQVYKGVNSEHSAADQAAKETEGLTLTYQGKVVPAYFHSACGDHTESSLAAFGEKQGYLPGVPCGFCKGSIAHDWKLNLSKHELSQRLSSLVKGAVKKVSVATRSPSGRAERIDVVASGGTKRISANDFRRLVGYVKIRSTWITGISESGGQFHFTGKGFGHGVGMCQWGANGMAQKGHAYDQIIQKYYPGTQIRNMY